MLSIIICSISPDYVESLTQNIQRTIGIKYEIIAIDNRKKHWPIAKVYNYGAQQAQYPYLFFVHEDVRMHSPEWGALIIQMLAKPDCGVIGFAGSKAKWACYSGWHQGHEPNVSYLYQGLKTKETLFIVANAHLNQPFSRVVTLDGLGMFVRKEVWEQYPFDEKLLTGFHCYDIDFSLQLVQAGYKNYVCCSNQLLIEHFSEGSFYSKDWLSITIRLHDKWKHLLPIAVPEFKIKEKLQHQYEEAMSYRFLKKLLRSDCDNSEKKKVFKEFFNRPFSWKHVRNCFSVIWKYIRYVRR